MHVVHLTSLIVIAAVWGMAWRVGCRWCLRCGIKERASLWALACVLPTAGLILAVHVLALVAIVLGRGLVTPEAVAVIFLALTWLTHRAVRHFASAEPNAEHAAASGEAPARLGVWWLPVFIVAGVYAAFLVDALTRYPTGYDGLHYHLPVAVNWMQQQRMDLIFGLKHQSFPENGMIVPFLLSFAKLERLFTIVHLPKALLLCLVIHGLSRAIGVTARGSVIGACIALSIPIVVFQSFSAYIDLYAAAAWLSALLALTWATRVTTHRRRRSLILLAGLAAGIALGSKTTFLVLVPLLGLAAIATEWIRQRGDTHSAPRPVRTAAVFALAALVCSGFWFIRGAVQAGNPVYPLGVDIAGQRILPGFVAEDYFPKRTAEQKASRWWDYPWRETKHSGTGYPFSVNNALGAAYTAFVPVGMLALLLSGRVRRPREPADRWLLIYVLLALGGVLLLLTVFAEMLRFVLPLVLVAVPVAAVMIDHLIDRLPRPTLVILSAALLVTAAVATLKPAHAFAGRWRDGVWDRAAIYEIPPVIDRLGPGSRILNLSSPDATYPLMGSNLDSQVITPPHWKLLLGGRPMSARALYDNEIDYIYIRGPRPDDWPDDLPIELIFNDTQSSDRPTTRTRQIYKVIPRHSQ
jgi:hypothetical protein